MESNQALPCKLRSKQPIIEISHSVRQIKSPAQVDFIHVPKALYLAPHQHAKRICPRWVKLAFAKFLVGKPQVCFTHTLGKYPTYWIYTKIMQISRRPLGRPHRCNQLFGSIVFKWSFHV